MQLNIEREPDCVLRDTVLLLWIFFFKFSDSELLWDGWKDNGQTESDVHEPAMHVHGWTKKMQLDIEVSAPALLYDLKDYYLSWNWHDFYY